MVDTSALLALDQFAYCLNHPVTLVDPTGTTYETLEAEHNFDHDSPYSEWHGSGGGIWSSFRRSLQAAADGLNMAMGKRNLPCLEKHHVLSNKNKKYTPLYEEIVRQYGMDLNGPENIIELEGHKGRHTNAYHDFMLFMLKEIDSIADGDIDYFYEGFGILIEFLLENAWLPYAR